MIEKLKDILRDNNIPFTQLSESTELAADLGLNSLRIIELASALEDAFDIEIPDRAIKSMNTIGDVIRLIETYESGD